MTKETAIVIFKEKNIRRVWYNNEWYFVIADVVAALTDSVNPSEYVKKMRSRDSELAKGWGQIVPPLSINTAGGVQKLNCANTEGVLRIIQSIPSPKAEPFKRWLAKVGYKCVQEIENPELAQERMKQLYEQKGYPQDWIDKRLRGIAIRQNLTDEWKDRGISAQSDYAILTAEISKATFGMAPTEYKQYKNLPVQSNENLRDHMTDLELIFTMLGEKVTTEISKKEKPTGMPQNKKVAKRGGKTAAIARKATEKELGRSVISKKNHLPALEKA
ncbi:MAG: phage antirepressor protein [Gammaproteobacteria bacterium RIFCSPLOWO2_02_FULL_42_14]|nr:MAG: phage antirepressor protein [Gammaproteobacteria bacterium RIFCSPHIGHO2_02_FULL_42_43]OGT27287.1 MAG: phage antirepressor protein [Gammaproteobacteria bacterium RIFCSPHIGHO2_01_FULL_42_8]OGT52961.1 MAG: phage antirepressor protein [Gammaproteobacteria bacterium RIFCSPHIGHO2_12_FULL_41_25]OGT61265.1 MAG: phage antirepressor protein [Gammaproteobacteria bacterium RIFCSPLOWO2_02_FULL_42_14]OGT87194.1 MAG: phage antirepressor protein [Gammaproteobacteria bacterium RIFCSPLOWO2_12_FULL_42_18]